MDSPHTPLHCVVVRVTEGGGVGQESFFFLHFRFNCNSFEEELLWGSYLSPLILNFQEIFLFSVNQTKCLFLQLQNFARC